MALTRAQLIAGDNTQGPVLPGQVQGVKAGLGVTIADNGTISFNPENAGGVVLTNNEEAYNGYVWPSNQPGNNTQLAYQNSALTWLPIKTFGFGLGQSNNLVKQSMPLAATGPAIGSGVNEAVNGSLYWNTNNSQLYVCVGNQWQPSVSFNSPAIIAELLSGSFTFYVNPEIGEDTYITGWYDQTRGISNQMVTAGYTPQKPFKTILRAALEVARIQNGVGQDSLSYDRFLIKCSTGLHLIDNDFGVAEANITAWASGFEPELSDLRKLNAQGYAGIILPRGVSIIGEDLRKTVIRPTYVPDKTGSIEANRGSIFRITGGAFFFNFTFKDQEGLEDSHHLLDCFSFVTQADLDTYYAKTKKLFAQSYENEIVNPGETEIVAPKPVGTPTESTDGVIGSSPYIFNCSVRSNYGLCGINADGTGVTGFKSMVVAQFTGTSLQKDMFCWQVYDSGADSWVDLLDSQYDDYIEKDPDDVRMNPDRVSFHVRAVNGAFIQEVSVFAIGQGIHHWVKNGGEISITNSNSSFGGCAAIADGYQSKAFPQDKNWNLGAIVVPSNLNNVNRSVTDILIGTVKESIPPIPNNTLAIELTFPLIESLIYPGVPEILANKGYSFTFDSYLWIENPEGNDWRAELTASAWNPDFPSIINIQTPMSNQDNQTPGQVVDGDALPGLAGAKVYIRRLLDTRTLEQRRYVFQLTNTDPKARVPQRDYIVQTTVGGSGGGISGSLPNSLMTAVYKSGNLPPNGDPVIKRSEIVIGRTNFDSNWVPSRQYRPGDTVRKDQKHYTCVVKTDSSTFNSEYWVESYVHMPSSYNAYDNLNNIAPQIIFDNDTDGFVGTTTCGFVFDPSDSFYCWKAVPKIKSQLISGTDYAGARQFLVGIGFTLTEADNILAPRNPDDRERDPASSSDMLGYTPDGAADALANWPLEFRRPSVIRLFSHAWEWAGFLNYTKALPAYQGDLSIQNQFSYYFTNSFGGRVYASGYNQEGFLVTPAGLTDLATGQTTDIEDLGGVTGIDTPQSFDNLTVQNLRVTSETILEGNVEFPTTAQATTIEQGIVNKLANITDLKNTNNPLIASDDEDINNSLSNGGVVTLNGLNAWKSANKLVSAATGSLEIWVSSFSGTARTLEQMLENPPITKANAVTTLGMAASYVNEVLSGSERTAIINIGAGLYNPTSTWNCNVQFRAYKRDLSALLWPSNNSGTTTVVNNYFDGTGYGLYDFSVNNNEATVNFWAYRLELRDSDSSGGQLHVMCAPRPMVFNRGVDFLGGFHFLGLADIIKALSSNPITNPAILSSGLTRSSFLLGAPGTVATNDAWSDDESDNVDNLLRYMRFVERNNCLEFIPYAGLTSIMQFLGSERDAVRLRDCVFGPGLPCRKGTFGVSRNALVTTNGLSIINIHNIYFRGVTTITSAGISGPLVPPNIAITSPVYLSDSIHYGKTLAVPPWTWKQTYHTFLGPIPNLYSPLSISLGSTFRVVNTNPDAGPFDSSYYGNGTGTTPLKLLPNHIQLLDSSGNIATNETSEENGPFFDQFMHAPSSLRVDIAWRGAGLETASQTLGRRGQGFVGKFGENGYNLTKTRGVLGGSEGVLDPETGFTFSPASKDYLNGRSIFQGAGALQGVNILSIEVAFASYEITAVSIVDNTLTLDNHPFSNGNTVRFLAIDSDGSDPPVSTLPAGLSGSVTYYIVEKTQNTFKVSRTEGGSAVDITGDLTDRTIVTLYTSFDVSIDPTEDLITCTDHPFLAGNRVVFTNTLGAAANGISSSISYYIISSGLTKDTFRVSASPEGDPIDITGSTTIEDYIVSCLGLSPKLVGAGFPTGYNPVIETDSSGFARLNLGLRSYGLGINNQFASQIPASNVIL